MAGDFRIKSRNRDVLTAAVTWVIFTTLLFFTMRRIGPAAEIEDPVASILLHIVTVSVMALIPTAIGFVIGLFCSNRLPAAKYGAMLSVPFCLVYGRVISDDPSPTVSSFDAVCLLIAGSFCAALFWFVFRRGVRDLRIAQSLVPGSDLSSK